MEVSPQGQYQWRKVTVKNERDLNIFTDCGQEPVERERLKKQEGQEALDGTHSREG